MIIRKCKLIMEELNDSGQTVFLMNQTNIFCFIICRFQKELLKFHIKYLEVQAKCFKQHQQVQVMKDQYPEESLTELLSISLHEVE